MSNDPLMLMKPLVWNLWFAGRRFVKPGIYVCCFGKNLRIVPFWFATTDIALVDFPESNVTYAKDQPEYRPLPCKQYDDGRIVFCWRLTFVQRLTVLFTGRLWHQVQTFGQPLQPQLLESKKPNL